MKAAASRIRPTPDRIVGSVLLACAAARISTEAWAVLRLDENGLIARLPDDAFYYLTIGRNLAAGSGPSFDGTDLTNGFQPLWQWLIGGAAITVDGTPLIRTVLCLQLALIVAAWAIVARLGLRHVGFGLSGVGIGAVVLTSPPLLARLLDGMEGALVVFTIALLMWAAHRWWVEGSIGAALLAGAASGACGLARLSVIPLLLIGPIALMMVTPRASWRETVSSRHLGAWFAGTVVVLVPWIATSLWSVGTLAPVSGTIKVHLNRELVGPAWSSSSLRLAARSLIEEAGRQLDAVVPGDLVNADLVRRGGLVAAGVATLVIIGFCRRTRPSALLLLAIVALAPARLVLDTVLVSSGVPPWYGAPIALATAVLAALVPGVLRSWLASVGHSESHRPARAMIGTLAILMALGIGTQDRDRPSGDWGRANAEAARALDDLAPAARTGAFDAGVVGWVRPGTRNLDGLVRSPEFVDRWLGTADSAGLLRDEGIEFLVSIEDDIRVPDCATAVWRSTIRADRPGTSLPVAVWDTRRC